MTSSCFVSQLIANVMTLVSKTIKTVFSLCNYIFACNIYTCTGIWYWQIECCSRDCHDAAVFFFFFRSNE